MTVDETTGSLFALFQSHFPKDRSRPFLQTPRAESWSYTDLEAGVARAAAVLRGVGVRPGDRVAVQIEKSPQAIVLYLACLQTGAVFVALNTAYTSSEVAIFLGDAQPLLLVCRPDRRAQLEAPAASAGVAALLTLDDAQGGSFAEAMAAARPDSRVEARQASDPAAILYTSGTTGRSKGAVLTQANLATNAKALHAAWGFVPEDVLLHVLPLYHAHGLFVALHTVLLNGSSMLFHRRFEAAAVLRALPEATVMMGVPTHYVRLLADPRFDRAVCQGMRLFISGSAPLREETFAAFADRTGHTILERYGMTETGMNASNPLRAERVPGSVGPALPGVELRVVDETGCEVPVGEVGRLEVRGENVFAGYWRMPEKTAEDFRADGFFVTGDLARIDERGYLHLVGREKDLVITGGLNVYPREVEDAIDALDGVLESAVFGVPHQDFGEAVTAMVVREKGCHFPDEDAIVAVLRERLAAFKLPKRVLFAAALPRNAMGKVRKQELRAQHAGLYRTI